MVSVGSSLETSCSWLSHSLHLLVHLLVSGPELELEVRDGDLQLGVVLVR